MQRVQSYSVGNSGTHAKFHNPKINHSWRIGNGSEEDREKNVIYSGHYVLPATPKGSRRALLRAIISLMIFDKIMIFNCTN